MLEYRVGPNGVVILPRRVSARMTIQAPKGTVIHVSIIDGEITHIEIRKVGP